MIGVMESQGKTLIQQKAELEAAAHAQQQKYGALQMEATRLRKELQEKTLEKKAALIEDFPLSRFVTPLQTSPPIIVRNWTAALQLKLRLYGS